MFSAIYMEADTRWKDARNKGAINLDRLQCAFWQNRVD